jgi:tetratricopeptide (TPR) repeat protein
MITPALMLAIKIERENGKCKIENGFFARCAFFHVPFPILRPRFLLFLATVLVLSGCSPPGPRALRTGKNLLDRGDYDGAVAQLKTATELMATNAGAWNDYGVALQHAGQPADAVRAYTNALRLNRDLVEAHYNLGCLWLEQNRFGDARAEFTTYTLRRNNTPEGWLKLGAVQLKLRDILAAEKSFSTAYSLNTNSAEALNGLGLARVAGGRPQDAARFFSAAILAHPDYAPALLNLATVNRQYLHDDAQALKNYRAYLALTPRPADGDAVNDLVNSLDRPAAVAADKTPPARESETAVSVKSNAPETKPAATAAVTRPLLSPRAQPGTKNVPAPPRPAATTDVVAVPREPVIAPPDTSAPETQARGSGPPQASQSYAQSGVTPLAANSPAPASAAPPAPKPEKVVPPAPPTFPRYSYHSPRKPAAGDRKAAGLAFADARQSEQNRDLPAAKNSYRRAAELDPSWFEAQYNYAVLAFGQKDLSQSLAASELALAIQPESVDARYIFALALKAAGYATDALNELKKILASNPDEARAQLALGNLYAEQMRDPAQARPHYLKWLELDPHNPQAINIRFWLSENPP